MYSLVFVVDGKADSVLVSDDLNKIEAKFEKTIRTETVDWFGDRPKTFLDKMVSNSLEAREWALDEAGFLLQIVKSDIL